MYFNSENALSCFLSRRTDLNAFDAAVHANKTGWWEESDGRSERWEFAARSRLMNPKHEVDRQHTASPVDGNMIDLSPPCAAERKKPPHSWAQTSKLPKRGLEPPEKRKPKPGNPRGTVEKQRTAASRALLVIISIHCMENGLRPHHSCGEAFFNFGYRSSQKQDQVEYLAMCCCSKQRKKRFLITDNGKDEGSLNSECRFPRRRRQQEPVQNNWRMPYAAIL